MAYSDLSKRYDAYFEAWKPKFCPVFFPANSTNSFFCSGVHLVFKTGSSLFFHLSLTQFRDLPRIYPVASQDIFFPNSATLFEINMSLNPYLRS